MPDKKVDADLTLSGAKVRADVIEVITSIGVEYTEGEVNELTIAATNPGKKLMGSGLFTVGTSLSWHGEPWAIAGRERAWGQDNTYVETLRCRSPLARKLRRTYKASAERKVSGGGWITGRVRSAGGSAICQPGAKQETIAQSSGRDRQSELDVIASLGGEQSRTFVERPGSVLWWGDRYWAWTTTELVGRRDWAVTWHADENTDALSAQLSHDDDDTETAASGTITVPYDVGRRIRLWDRMVLAGFGDENGLWLVTGLSVTADLVSPVAISIAIPKKPSPKAGSAQ